MAINFPNINPVIVHIFGPFSITWYALSYVAGILLGASYYKFIAKKCNLDFSKKFYDDIVTYVILGIIIGGRLGYVIFYSLGYHLDHPLEIFATWNGGMSFHGGALGLATALYLLAKKHKIPFLQITDIISVVAPIGIFFGRIANFINGELYGKVTNVSWGVVFPNAGASPRHPSQIYEALLEGALILLLQYILVFCSKIVKKNGLLSASFLIQYSVFRYIIEFFRAPDSHIGYINEFTMGQILSIPMIAVALVILLQALQAKKK